MGQSALIRSNLLHCGSFGPQWTSGVFSFLKMADFRTFGPYGPTVTSFLHKSCLINLVESESFH